ncbi:hypothetical protein GCM10008922_32190 [Faecalicatena contorta]|uniref:cache domain-containing sensor histidine kinase n=1 Tax=Faecalicatena contorta TaxID=39482 RepID=UPI0031D67EC3
MMGGGCVRRKQWKCGKFFSKSYFNKIAVGYIILTLVISSLLFSILSQNLITIKYDQSLIISDQIAVTIDNFLKNKIEGTYSIQQKLYLEKEKWKTLTNQLMYTEDNGTDKASGQRDINITLSNTIFEIDEHFKGLFLGGGKSGNILWCGSNMSAVENEFFKKYSADCDLDQLNSIKILSVRNERSVGNVFSLFLINPVVNPEKLEEKIGVLALYFDVTTLQQSYKDLKKYMKGDIYIFDNQGTLLFDDKANYKLPEDFPQEKLLNKRTEKIKLGKMVYNTYYSAKNQYYIVNAFPMKSVMNDVYTLQGGMVGLLLLLLFLAIVLNVLVSKFFGRRIRPIIDTMEQVKEGNLTSFPIQRNYDDEVGYIYSELLRMCVTLDDHIKKEYVYQLRQKEMELYVLQTQIDPHFLYNTLESIRMNLFIKGEKEASKMIWILADLFRNMMKKDVVVSNREEINFLKFYLELFHFRFEKRIEYEFKIDTEVYHYATIKHILQPIVENALVHGIKEKVGKGNLIHIVVRGIVKDGNVIFTIEDNGCGIEKEKLLEIRRQLSEDEISSKSIGIFNVENRLQIVYGKNNHLQIESERNVGTRVTISIKALRKGELEKYVQNVDC